VDQGRGGRRPGLAEQHDGAHGVLADAGVGALRFLDPLAERLAADLADRGLVGRPGRERLGLAGQFPAQQQDDGEREQDETGSTHSTAPRSLLPRVTAYHRRPNGGNVLVVTRAGLSEPGASLSEPGASATGDTRPS